MFTFLIAGPAQAQTFKCTDAAGKITYTDTQCVRLGLKDAGEVKNHLIVNPDLWTPATAHAANTAPSVAVPAVSVAGAPDETADAQRRCFIVKTAKGKVTRCNDKPVNDASQ